MAPAICYGSFWPFGRSGSHAVNMTWGHQMDGSDADRPRPSLSRADNRLVRAVARVPATVQRKLLVASTIVVVLLIAVGVLGIGVLGQSNDRVSLLGVLPQRVATYTQLQADSRQLSQQFQSRDLLVTPCAFGLGCVTVPGCGGGGCPGPTFHPDAGAVSQADEAIQQALNLIGSLSDVAHLGFGPSPEERTILSEIHSEYGQLATATTRLVANDRGGTYSVNQPQSNVADNLNGNADRLVALVNRNAAALIAQNQSSYLGSQHMFIGVAAGSVVLALLLAFILSRALTGPIREMDTRLAAIASGDFSGHLDVPNRDEFGALAANLNRMNDELGRLYRELENASRHKSEFLANMSHELRTPLNAVIGFSEVLQDRLFGELNEKQAEYVSDIHISGRHLLALINDILDLSKIEAGRMELQISTVTLSELLESSVALMRERATRQGIRLGLEVNPTIGVIEADERKLKQVLFNLLSNALKFTSSGGHIEVSACGYGSEIVVSVHDDGVGIAAADQTRIFEEFQQVGTSQIQEGTGLGLALSLRFVELHGGRLWVESEPGKGSTFTFTLPRTHRAGAGAENDGSSDPESAGVAVPTTAPLS
jgi:signal transduction histidine kinase